MRPTASRRCSGRARRARSGRSTRPRPDDRRVLEPEEHRALADEALHDLRVRREFGAQELRRVPLTPLRGTAELCDILFPTGPKCRAPAHGAPWRPSMPHSGSLPTYLPPHQGLSDPRRCSPGLGCRGSVLTSANRRIHDGASVEMPRRRARLLQLISVHHSSDVNCTEQRAHTIRGLADLKNVYTVVVKTICYLISVTSRYPTLEQKLSTAGVNYDLVCRTTDAFPGPGRAERRFCVVHLAINADQVGLIVGNQSGGPACEYRDGPCHDKEEYDNRNDPIPDLAIALRLG